MPFPKQTHDFPDDIEEELSVYRQEDVIYQWGNKFILFFTILFFWLVIMWVLGIPINGISFTE